MRKSKKNSVDRRNFLKSAAAGAAVLAANPRAVAAQELIASQQAVAPQQVTPPQQLEARRVGPPPMSPEAEAGMPSHVEVLTLDRSGSDFMVDVIKSLNV